MSGPILITTSTYNGPERRKLHLMSEQQSDPEKRQSVEVAIAKLEINVEYIKAAIEKLSNAAPVCNNCSATSTLNQHLKDHREGRTNQKDWIKWIVTTGIAAIALIKAFLVSPPVK